MTTTAPETTTRMIELAPPQAVDMTALRRDRLHPRGVEGRGSPPLG